MGSHTPTHPRDEVKHRACDLKILFQSTDQRVVNIQSHDDQIRSHSLILEEDCIRYSRDRRFYASQPSTIATHASPDFV